MSVKLRYKPSSERPCNAKLHTAHLLIINYNSSSHAPHQHPSTLYFPHSPAPTLISPSAPSFPQDAFSQSQHSFYPSSYVLLRLRRGVLVPTIFINFQKGGEGGGEGKLHLELFSEQVRDVLPPPPHRFQ
jgi:hypothetical protein